MKFLKILIPLALTCLGLSVRAQSGFDYYAVPKTVVVTAPSKFTGSTVFSNSPIDIHRAIGIGKIDVNIFTNGVAGALTVSVYGSADLTNWATLTSCSVTTNTTALTYTNNYWLSGISTTNNTMVPGTITTPVAATAGFATKYLSPYPYTSTSVVSIPAGGNVTFGFNFEDAPRYLSVQYVGASTGTNFVSATATFRRDE